MNHPRISRVGWGCRAESCLHQGFPYFQAACLESTCGSSAMKAWISLKRKFKNMLITKGRPTLSNEEEGSFWHGCQQHCLFMAAGLVLTRAVAALGQKGLWEKLSLRASVTTSACIQRTDRGTVIALMSVYSERDVWEENRCLCNGAALSWMSQEEEEEDGGEVLGCLCRAAEAPGHSSNSVSLCPPGLAPQTCSIYMAQARLMFWSMPLNLKKLFDFECVCEVR